MPMHAEFDKHFFLEAPTGGRYYKTLPTISWQCLQAAITHQDPMYSTKNEITMSMSWHNISNLVTVS